MPDVLGPASILFSGLSGLFGGGGGDSSPGELVMTSPGGKYLLDKLIDQYARGGGDFGLGASLKAGQGALTQMMGARGISPESGVYQSALSNMFANAIAQDAAARRMYGLQLATAGPATAHAQGLSSEWSRYGTRPFGTPGTQLGWQVGHYPHLVDPNIERERKLRELQEWWNAQ